MAHSPQPQFSPRFKTVIIVIVIERRRDNKEGNKKGIACLLANSPEASQWRFMKALAQTGDQESVGKHSDTALKYHLILITGFAEPEYGLHSLLVVGRNYALPLLTTYAWSCPTVA